MLHNILRQNAVNCVLKRRLTAVGPFSRNKSHMLFLPYVHILMEELESTVTFKSSYHSVVET